MADEIPRRIAQYEILRLIGRGGMGVLYQARDTVRQRDVALKVMSANIVEDEEARARFRQEAQLAARQHRNIVKVFEFGEDGDVPFIAMEFLRGRSLADRLTSPEPMTLETKLDIVTQVCDGLQCLHEEGIVHRDVKPANIWLLEDGGVKLLDLGVAKHGNVNLTQYGNVVGSVAYIAPEQLSGSRVDGRADVFSAGVVLFELLSGQRPFHAESITAVMMKVLHEAAPDVRVLVPGLPENVARAVETALQKNPDDRYADAGELAADLRLARAMGEASLAPARSTASASGGDLTLADTAISLRAPTDTATSLRAPTDTAISLRAPAANAPVVEHDPVLHSRPSVQVPAAVMTPVVKTRGMNGLLWAAAATAVVAVVGFGSWLLFRSSRPEVYQLDIRSAPAGASISLDGATTGRRTPAVIPVQAHPRRIGLSLDGYEPIDEPLAATADLRASLQFTLRRLLQLQSDPAGARIVLDGRDTGLVTPVALPLGDDVPSGIELVLDGHEPGRAAITPETIEAGTVRLTLVPLRGSGSGSPPPAALRGVDVRVTGQYPFEVHGCGTMSPASERHALKVTSPCKLRLVSPQYFLNDVRNVNAPAGGHMELSAPPLATVQLRTRHLDCTLLMEGRSLGSPPVDLELAAGTHSVTVQCKDETLQTKPFEIEAGKSVRRIDEYLR